MTTTLEPGTGEIPVLPLRGPIPSWLYARRNQVRITYIGMGSTNPRNLSGRIINSSSGTITILKNDGTAVELAWERLRSCTVLIEGDTAGRIRVLAIRALSKAMRALARTDAVGGAQQEAADLIAFAQALIPALKKSDAARVQEIWLRVDLERNDVIEGVNPLS